MMEKREARSFSSFYFSSSSSHDSQRMEGDADEVHMRHAEAAT